MNVSPVADGRTAKPDAHPIRTRAVAVAGAVATALVAWVIAVPILDVDLRVSKRPGGSDFQTIGAGAVAATSLIAALLGWGLLELIERRTTWPSRVWLGVAIVVLVLSLGAPLSSGVDPQAKVTLTLLHVAVGLSFIGVLGRTFPSETSSSEKKAHSHD